MTSKVRTVDFLPQIFQTKTNAQFLAATLDQLVQNPEFRRVQGYIGDKIGVGVNPKDSYVVEPTKQRTDYQLDPCVVSLVPETDDINSVITFPGINDSIKVQGGIVDNADRLYKSDYYTWDPFVEFDMVANYSQYYWLPEGPPAVTVSATDIPTIDTFYVTRENGVYKFDKVAGNNPRLTLARGGQYKFIIDQTYREAVTFNVSSNDDIPNSAYVIDFQDNPELTLQRGGTYYFNLNMPSLKYPFYIKTEPTLGFGAAYNNGVYRNGAVEGQVIFVVPDNAPDELYYTCATQRNLGGKIHVVDATAGDGPGFWIQTQPGVSGKLPEAPNVSSREVLGVTNNGTNTSEIIFDVPLLDAQEFYFDLTDVGYVDLLATEITYNQLQGMTVAQFDSTFLNGIDGITNLNGRTIVFTVPDSGSSSRAVWYVEYASVNKVQTIVLSQAKMLDINNQITIGFGTQWSRTKWYIAADSSIEQVPLLTSTLDKLYYQDGTDPNMFGVLDIIEEDLESAIIIEDIIGSKHYTSPNGVTFTNGLKVTFRGLVAPESYMGNNYLVEGVGTAIQLLPVGRFVTPEKCIRNIPIPYSTLPFDIGGYDGFLDAPIDPEYVVSSRTSLDRNPWSRSNRWFHRDVILQTNEYNKKTNKIVEIDYLVQARRPVLQFRGGTKLFDFGTFGIDPVNVIDFAETDALKNVNGQPAYIVDGFYLGEGSTVIFAGDTDLAIRRTVFRVKFVPLNETTEHAYAGTDVIYLEPIYQCEVNDSTVCLNGQYPDDEYTRVLSGNYDMAPYASTPFNAPAYENGYIYNHGIKGVTFYFDGITWVFSQQMVKINQAILFDLFDQNGFSLSNKDVYPSSSFRGCKLFSYAIGEGQKDEVLGFPVKYLNIANLGDIVFNNDLYTQTYRYVTNDTAHDDGVSNGFAREYYSRTDFIKEIGWQNAATQALDRQEIQYVYDGNPLRLNVLVEDIPDIKTLQIFINGTYINPSRYDVLTVYGKTQIMWKDTYTIGSVVEVAFMSEQVDSEAYYRIPINLSNNALNENSPLFTLGTVRTHFNTIGVTIPGFRGYLNGANNSRDLGNLVPYGLQILQQSSPLTFAGYFMRSKEYNIFNSLAYNNREYTQFKNQLLTTVANSNVGFMTPGEILDMCVSQINLGKTNIDSFYWSDMLPAGGDVINNVYEIIVDSNGVFPTQQIYDFTSANFKGLLVYVTVINEYGSEDTELLERGVDYVVSSTEPTLTILRKIEIGNVVTIAEYPNTAGNFVPNTPSKMGLYPKYRPQMYYDTTYVRPQWVIQGHDGSITVAFGDIRDLVLLEFEKRIYNNIKTDDNPVPLTASDVVPGFFRKTGYSKAEIGSILELDFLSWVGWNNLDYRTQFYDANDPFTYNYSQCGARLDRTYQLNNIDEEPLPGAWRGINLYFYDTIDPARTPWEMLGFSEEPCWWCDRYGPAPYTNGNLVLWEDLEKGYVANPAGPYYLHRYARPGLTDCIPTNDNGELLSPMYSVVGQFNEYSYQKSWTVMDGGPVEAAWRTSSAYPFSVMRLLALTRPAQFFALFADRDRYRYDHDIHQFLYDGRYRLGPAGVQVYGDGVSKASYINWIVDYNRQLGQNSTADLTNHLDYLTVKLGYRVGGYTDYEYFQMYADHAMPGSENDSRRIPPENCTIELYKNQPSLIATYSALTVERTETGYRLGGYDSIRPYFKAFISQSTGILRTMTSGGVTVRVPANYTDKTVTVPYATVLISPESVVEFILGYGLYLESLGMSFTTMENGLVMNWDQMAKEFLYFSGQGWAPGTTIALNPAGARFTITKPGLVADTIESITPENMLLDQYRAALPTRDVDIERLENTLSVSSVTGRTLSFARIEFVSYEDIVVLDNLTAFNDLIYDPVTGARQSRMMVNGWVTTDWNGTVNAPGFILNRKQSISEWKPKKRYTKGQIVLFKNNYWSALDIINPKEKFEYSDWTISDYEKINQGLLNNPPNMSDQLANSYDIYSANLNLDQDLLSYGLIGFRPRKYMSDLNLDSVSQVNLYQQFLKSKGTLRSAELFSYADLGKEAGTYDIHEIWGVLASTYGANANKSFVEFRLNEANLTSNPCTVQAIRPFGVSQANQTVLVNDIWRTSAVITSPDIFPVNTRTYSETALPSAGYVDLNDVDITVFDINEPSSIVSKLDVIGEGTIIWAAKSNNYDWNIYRCVSTGNQITSVTNNLSGTALVSFNGRHGLSVGDLVVIRYINTSIDGVYRVLTVTGINTIVIGYSFGNTSQSTVYATGIAFKLESTRVAQASDVANLPFVNDLSFDSKVWVDNNGYGLWEVLEKTQPFNFKQSLLPKNTQDNTLFGYSVAQSYSGLFAFAGSPGENNGEGTVRVYKLEINPNNITQQPYLYVGDVQPRVTDTVGYGTTLAVGKSDWVAVSAPGSNVGTGYVLLYTRDTTLDYYVGRQLLQPPTLEHKASDPSEFGAAVSICYDETWMYIGAPTSNKVYLYSQVVVPNESVLYEADGITSEFNYDEYVLIDSAYPDQLTVTVDNRVLEFPYDYRLVGGNVVMTFTPTIESVIRIARRTNIVLNSFIFKNVRPTGGTGYGFEVDVSIDGGVYAVESINQGTQYEVGDNLLVPGTLLGGTTPENDLRIFVSNVTDAGEISSFQWFGTGIQSAQSYSLRPYLFTATNVYSFALYEDNLLLRPFVDYTFDATTRIVTLVKALTENTDVIARTSSYWMLANVINGDVSPLARFGQAVGCSTTGRQVLIGAPYDTMGTDKAIGSTTCYNRTVYWYNITEDNQRQFEIPHYNGTPIQVTLNGQVLTNASLYINGQYTVVLNTVVLEPSVSTFIGDDLVIDTSELLPVQTMSSGTEDTSLFGFAVDFSSRDDEIFVGAPSETTDYDSAGTVRRYVNQSMAFGTTTSTNANPVLQYGDTILVNGAIVYIPMVPDNTAKGMADAINQADIPNVTAATTADLTLTGNGRTTVFSVGSIYQSAGEYNTVVYVNGTLQSPGVAYVYDNNAKTITFATAPALKAKIVVVSGRIIISVKTQNNADASGHLDLTVLPGQGNAFYELGFNTLVEVQKITSPNPSTYAKFGYSVSIDNSSKNLVVGSPDGSAYAAITFDGGTTYFDSHSTVFSSTLVGCGVVYTYDYLPATNPSINNVGKYVFGQQIYKETLDYLDRFGLSTNYINTSLMVGAPMRDTATNADTGEVYVFKNTDDKPSWQITHIQVPTVDSYAINSVFMYDRLVGSWQQYFDCINPIQGKILGIAAQNIDYVGSVDPANYNVGTIHNVGDSWGAAQIGKIWWDTDTVRFLDPNQNNLDYTSRQWGQPFPGSQVDIYQWIVSDVPPNAYTDQGTPLSTSTYVLVSRTNDQGYAVIEYYYWVRGLSTIEYAAGKTLSTTSIAQYISDPRSSGIPYVALINESTVAIYNGLNYISAADTILHVGYDQTPNDDCVHTEYQTILSDDRESFVNDTTYRKMLDSYSGADTNGRTVPDPMLSPGEKYGVQFRPRQSMFVNRYEALRNYLTSANTIIAQYPVSETKAMTLLFSQQPPPPAKDNGVTYWNESVPTVEILRYQDYESKPDGYRYLVLSNSEYRGLWTILEIDRTFTSIFKLVQIQTYYTPAYWSYINWYLPGYNPDTELVAKVPYYAALASLSVADAPVDSTVMVLTNSRGKYELYKRTTEITWLRVGLQDGTVQFSDALWNYASAGLGYDNSPYTLKFFDEEPLTETRNIVRAINEQILVDEMKLYRNELLISTFEYIYSELGAPYWLLKTSLINVEHRIRGLEPYPQYIPDNQTFVLDYINEVKPYHTVVKEFNLVYYGTDVYDGEAITDFDCPSRWDEELVPAQYVSPMLLPYTHAATTIQSTVGDLPDYSEVWDTKPWKQWHDNFTMGVYQIRMIDQGIGYIDPPSITVVGDCIEPCIAGAIVDFEGRVTNIEILYPGYGYTTTPNVMIAGIGTEARAVAMLGNAIATNPITNEDFVTTKVRSISTTIKYDRCEYESKIRPWSSTQVYQNGDLVRLLNRVWMACNPFLPFIDNNQFDPEQWVYVPPGDNSDVDLPCGMTMPTLSGVDRTMGYYQPTVNQPGLELGLLIEGVTYPGVQVWGQPFVEPTFEPFDTTPYAFGDAIDKPGSYEYGDFFELNAIFQSSYSDLYLGTRYTDINVQGDSFISSVANYAPEELVLGASFDTVDIRVYTRPNGHHEEAQGHGFPERVIKKACVTVDSTFDTTVDFSNMVLFVTALVVTNQTTRRDLTQNIDYTVDWDNEVVTVINNVSENDVIVVEVFGPGGGTQIFKEVYSDQAFSDLLIDVPYQEISSIGWFVNGEPVTNFTYQPVDEQTLLTFGTPVVTTDLATIVVIAPTYLQDSTEVDYSWATPVTQVIPAVSGVNQYTLLNSTTFTNPVTSVVTLNGLRLKSAAGLLYRAYNGESEFMVPYRFGGDPSTIPETDIVVYIDGILSTQGVDYVLVTDATDNTRYVNLLEIERQYEQVLVAVTADVDCYITDDQLFLNVPVSNGDILSVTTWNDTRQQDVVTQVFVGPEYDDIEVTQGYSITRYSPDSVDFGPGSFDCAYYVPEARNNIILGTVIAEPSRLWVTVNGRHIFYGSGFTTRVVRAYQGYSMTVYDYAVLPDTSGSYDYSFLSTEIVLPYTLSDTDVVMVTVFTDILNTDATAYRIFQDMRGFQTVHEITRDTTTTLTQPLSQQGDVIYVKDATHLNMPNFAADSWGVLTINGERIMYRELNLVSNTVSSLLRGTGGTGADSHDNGSITYDMSRGTILPKRYQNYVVSNTTLSEGNSKVYTAKDIDLSSLMPTQVYEEVIEPYESTPYAYGTKTYQPGSYDYQGILKSLVRVYVAGVRQLQGWTLVSDGPVVVEFDWYPPKGVEVTILVVQANSWNIPIPAPK